MGWVWRRQLRKWLINKEYVGIDYSITSPSVCLLAEDDSFINSKFYFLTSVKKNVGTFHNIQGFPHKDWLDDMERYMHIADWVWNVSNFKIDDRVYIEGYSLNSKGLVAQIHENTAVLKYILYTNHIKHVTIPPTVIKKVYSGKGNATKELMYAKFLETNPDIRDWLGIARKPKIGNPINDLIDSYAAALVGKYDERYKISP